VIVPLKPVMAAKISLLNDRKMTNVRNLQNTKQRSHTYPELHH
jgi:hypothetical protein